MRNINPNMSWVDFRNANDIVPHAQIIKVLKPICAAPNVIVLLKSTMIDQKTESISSDIKLGKKNINRDIFQGDSLSPLLYVLSLIPLTLVLRQMKERYSLEKGKSKLNHVLFMDHLKFSGNNQNEIDSLAKTVETVTKDIGIKFGIDNCGVLATNKEVGCNGI